MARFEDVVETRDQFRSVMGEPSDKVTRKTLSALDRHCGVFIARSPFRSSFDWESVRGPVTHLEAGTHGQGHVSPSNTRVVRSDAVPCGNGGKRRVFVKQVFDTQLEPDAVI